VKKSKKKTQQDELIKRQIQEWGLKKPSSARNKVWDRSFKYDKCPKGHLDGLLLVDSNPLVWWKKYSATFPYLAQVARRYLVMPTTSAPVERLFSVAGQVVTAMRNRLHPETVTILVFRHEALPLHRDMKFQSFLDTMSTDGDVELVGD
jgi:hypothetical protein